MNANTLYCNGTPENLYHSVKKETDYNILFLYCHSCFLNCSLHFFLLSYFIIMLFMKIKDIVKSHQHSSVISLVNDFNVSAHNEEIRKNKNHIPDFSLLHIMLSLHISIGQLTDCISLTKKH